MIPANLGVHRDPNSNDLVGARSARALWLVLGLTTLIKVFLAAAFPVTSDEAYFLVWGEHLDYGYYDHPGMTGWWMWLALQISDAPLVIRLPAILGPLAVAFVIRSVLRQTDPDKADLVTILFLVSPTNLWNFFTTTDGPVFLFGFIGAAFTWRSYRRAALVDAFVAGLFLGAAFFAKYVAVPLGVAVGVFLLVWGPRRLARFLAFVAGVLPWAALNVAWLWDNGWTNILFNFFNRQEPAQFRFYGPLIVLGFAVLYAGPFVAWSVLKPGAEGRADRSTVWKRVRASGLHAFVVTGGLTLVAFLGLSLFKPVGIHWLLPLAPMGLLLMAPAFDTASLQRIWRPTLYFSLVPVVVLASILPVLTGLGRFALEAVGQDDNFGSLILGVYPEEVLPVLQPYADDYALMTASYAKASILGYHARKHVPVFGKGSCHGRQDDFITDFSQLDGEDIMIVTNRARDIEACRPWFAEIEIVPMDVRDAHLTLILCRGFDFEGYRDEILRAVAKEFYAYPRWMASFAKPGPFARRYGFEEADTVFR